MEVKSRHGVKIYKFHSDISGHMTSRVPHAAGTRTGATKRPESKLPNFLLISLLFVLHTIFNSHTPPNPHTYLFVLSHSQFFKLHTHGSWSPPENAQVINATVPQTMPRALPPIEGKNGNNINISPSIIESAAGFSAGVVSCLTVHPLDLLKNRLQCEWLCK